MRWSDPDAKLATAYFHLAREHGYPSWRALKAVLIGSPVRGIASRVMRFAAVADVERSVGLYRDVLGFVIKGRDGGCEAVLGPARMRFGKDGFAPKDYVFKNPQPPDLEGNRTTFSQTFE